jgi:hypothetical protein
MGGHKDKADRARADEEGTGVLADPSPAPDSRSSHHGLIQVRQGRVMNSS